jgi:hypothetical protein
MSRFDRLPDVPVVIGPCECPGAPHGDGDIVYLAPVLSAAGGMAAQAAINAGMADDVRLQELLWRVFRDHGVTGWNLEDENGPVPVTPDNLELALPYGKGGRAVADKADELYSEDMLAPFLDLVKTIQAKRASDERDERRKRSKGGSISSSPPETSAPSTSTRTRRPRSSTATSEGAPPAA